VIREEWFEGVGKGGKEGEMAAMWQKRSAGFSGGKGGG